MNVAKVINNNGGLIAIITLVFNVGVAIGIYQTEFRTIKTNNDFMMQLAIEKALQSNISNPIQNVQNTALQLPPIIIQEITNVQVENPTAGTEQLIQLIIEKVNRDLKQVRDDFLTQNNLKLEDFIILIDNQLTENKNIDKLLKPSKIKTEVV